MTRYGNDMIMIMILIMILTLLLILIRYDLYMHIHTAYNCILSPPKVGGPPWLTMIGPGAPRFHPLRSDRRSRSKAPPAGCKWWWRTSCCLWDPPAYSWPTLGVTTHKKPPASLMISRGVPSNWGWFSTTWGVVAWGPYPIGLIITTSSGDLWPLQRHEVPKHGHPIDERRRGNSSSILWHKARCVNGIVNEGGPCMSDIFMYPRSPEKDCSEHPRHGLHIQRR